MFSPTVYDQNRPATPVLGRLHSWETTYYVICHRTTLSPLWRQEEAALDVWVRPEEIPSLNWKAGNSEKSEGVELVNDGGGYGVNKTALSTETSSQGQGHYIDWLNIKLSRVCVCVSYVPPEMHTEKSAQQWNVQDDMKIQVSSRNDCKH